MTNKIVTLVTGGNRGMGLALIKALHAQGQQLIMGSRDLAKGRAAVEAAHLSDVTVVQLDVTDSQSIQAAVNAIQNQYGQLDILINNAGAAFDHHQRPSLIKLETIQADLNLNFLGTIAMTQACLPLLTKSSPSKIINISSMMGSLTNALDPQSSVYHASAIGYQASKAALNMFTIQLAKELQTTNITVNAVDPGMVATEFGGITPELASQHGAKSIAHGIQRTIDLATHTDNTTTGTFSNTDGPVAW